MTNEEKVKWVTKNQALILKELGFESSPTLPMVKKWLQEEKGIGITILVAHKWKYVINRDSTIIPYSSFKNIIKSYKKYETYEDALSSAIDKSLDILTKIKNK